MSQADNELRVAITGAGGYLGQNLCRRLQDGGAYILRLTSDPGRGDGKLPSAQFTLRDGVTKGIFTNNRINALVHAAYDFTPRSRASIWESNVKGSIDLFKAAREEGVERIVFISTMSAYAGCRSLYGSAKLEVENALEEMRGGCSIRPGLIYSTPIAHSGGMVGSILKSLARGVIPIIGKGDQELYLSHEADLAQLIQRLLRDPPGRSPIVAANPKPYTLRKIIELLAQTEAKQGRLLPVPWRLAWAGVRSLEAAGVKTKFRSDSILSLVHQNPNPDFSGLPEGIVFRDFAAAIHDQQQ